MCEIISLVFSRFFCSDLIPIIIWGEHTFSGLVLPWLIAWISLAIPAYKCFQIRLYSHSLTYSLSYSLTYSLSYSFTHPLLAQGGTLETLTNENLVRDHFTKNGWCPLYSWSYLCLRITLPTSFSLSLSPYPSSCLSINSQRLAAQVSIPRSILHV
jgi:hypothetical protein